MKESNIVSILSTLLIKCHSYLLQDNKKSAQEDIKYIHSLLTHSYIESDLLKMFTCILSLYNVYATDKGGTSILFRIRRIKKKVKFYLKHPKFSIKKMYSTIKYIV